MTTKFYKGKLEEDGILVLTDPRMEMMGEPRKKSSGFWIWSGI